LEPVVGPDLASQYGQKRKERVAGIWDSSRLSILPLVKGRGNVKSRCRPVGELGDLIQSV